MWPVKKNEMHSDFIRVVNKKIISQFETVVLRMKNLNMFEDDIEFLNACITNYCSIQASTAMVLREKFDNKKPKRRINLIFNGKNSVISFFISLNKGSESYASDVSKDPIAYMSMYPVSKEVRKIVLNRSNYYYNIIRYYEPGDPQRIIKSPMLIKLIDEHLNDKDYFSSDDILALSVMYDLSYRDDQFDDSLFSALKKDAIIPIELKESFSVWRNT